MEIYPNKKELQLIAKRNVPIMIEAPSFDNPILFPIQTPTLLGSCINEPTKSTEMETNIYLTNRTQLRPYSFQIVKVHCDHDGLVTIQPHWRTTNTYNVMTENGIAGIRRNRQFKLWIGNLSGRHVFLPKHMRVALATPPPSYIGEAHKFQTTLQGREGLRSGESASKKKTKNKGKGK